MHDFYASNNKDALNIFHFLSYILRCYNNMFWDVYIIRKMLTSAFMTLKKFDMCVTTVKGWLIWKNIYDNLILLILIDTCIIIFHFLQGIFRTETNDLEWECLTVQAIGYGSSPEGDCYIIRIHVVGAQQSLQKMCYSVCLSLSYNLLD